MRWQISVTVAVNREGQGMWKFSVTVGHCRQWRQDWCNFGRIINQDERARQIRVNVNGVADEKCSLVYVRKYYIYIYVATNIGPSAKLVYFDIANLKKKACRIGFIQKISKVHSNSQEERFKHTNWSSCI